MSGPLSTKGRELGIPQGVSFLGWFRLSPGVSGHGGQAFFLPAFWPQDLLLDHLDPLRPFEMS